MPKNQILSVEILASLFMQLARVETAGIPAIKALSLLKTKDKQVNQQLVKMQQLLISGISIANAGFNAGIFTQTHKALLNAGEISGQLAMVFQQQAEYYKNKSRCLKKIKSQLYLPVFVLLLSLLIKPMPLFLSGAIALVSYLSMSVGIFLLIAGLCWLAYKLSVWFKPFFHRLQLQLPIINSWFIKRQVNEFLWILAVLLEGGVTASEALPLATASIKNSVLRKRFDSSIRKSNIGDSVTHILASIKVIPATTIQTIHTGELSGSIASTLLHFTQHQRGLINIDDDALAKWIPRWCYAAVILGVMA